MFHLELESSLFGLLCRCRDNGQCCLRYTRYQADSAHRGLERRNATMKTMFRDAALTVAVAGALLVSVGARADNLVMTGWAVPGQHPTFALSIPDETVYAGGFNAVFQGKSFTAYCVDLNQSFSWNSPFAVTTYSASVDFGAVKADAMNRLYTQHVSEVDTVTESAAFQLALWEIVSESPGGANSLSRRSPNRGSFYIKSSSDGGAARNLANSWLAGLGSGATGGYQLTVLHNAFKQDQLMAIPVPEPETYATMLAGLGLLGVAVRRRQSNAV
jgi:hypothetical protein